jgi:hypothetical protein
MASGYRSRSLTEAVGRPSAWLRVGDRSALFWLVPFAVAAVFGVVFLVQLPHNLWVIGWNSDYASGFTLPTTLVKAGTGGNTVLSTTGAYVPLWFGLLTATLPLHRQLWEIAPTGLFVLTALTVGWSVAQVASRRAGALAALLILVASPRALYIFMAPVAHNTVYPVTALLGAYLVWLARGEGRGRVTTWALPPLAGVALGACIASDALLIATGVVPFALTAMLAALRRDRRSRVIAASALTTAIVAVPIAKLTSTTMGSLGYATLPPSTETASLSTLPVHAELMWEGLKALFNGYLSETTPSAPRSALGVACQAIMVAGLLTVLVVGVRATARFVAAGVRRADQTRSELMRALHVVYWAGSAGATCVTFALSQRTEYVHESYYATLILSVAAIVVLLPRSRAAPRPPASRSRAAPRLPAASGSRAAPRWRAASRWLLSAGASIFFTASIVGLASDYMESYVLPIARTPGYQARLWVPSFARYESQIVAFAKANDAVTGYAGYGDASNLTWSSDERLLVRPVQVCGTQEGIGICPFFLARVPAWYRPAQRRTFLLVDSTEIYLPSLPEGLGRPLAARTFGPAQVYVYPYDLASRMGPASD